MWTEIINRIVDFIQAKKAEEKETVANIAEILKSIGKCIEKAAESIERGEYPQGACAKIQAYSQLLVQKLEGKMESNTLKDLEALLIEASNIERDFARREDPDTTTKLFFAGAYFQAMGSLHGI